MSGMNPLIAAFAVRAIRGEPPMHGPGGAKILAFVDQGGVDLGRGKIAKAFGIPRKVDGLNSPTCNFDQIFTKQVSPPPMILASDCPDSSLCPAGEPK